VLRRRDVTMTSASAVELYYDPFDVEIDGLLDALI
jgi:hypothetical protein